MQVRVHIGPRVKPREWKITTPISEAPRKTADLTVSEGHGLAQISDTMARGLGNDADGQLDVDAWTFSHKRP